MFSSTPELCIMMVGLGICKLYMCRKNMTRLEEEE
jgi:hypothetical protein